MKFNMPKDWCEKMAKAEQGHSISAGSHELAQCPTCRGFNPEKSWCDTCDKTGVVLAKRDIPSLKDE